MEKFFVVGMDVGYRVQHDGQTVGQYHKRDHPFDGFAVVILGGAIKDLHEATLHYGSC